MIEFVPETINELKKRFPKALEKIWDLDIDLNKDRPGMHRTHIFDFNWGLRLIISRDVLYDSISKIHISVSWKYLMPVNLGQAESDVKNTFELIGGKGKLKLIHISSGGTLHWIVEE